MTKLTFFIILSISLVSYVTYLLYREGNITSFKFKILKIYRFIKIKSNKKSKPILGHYYNGGNLVDELSYDDNPYSKTLFFSEEEKNKITRKELAILRDRILEETRLNYTNKISKDNVYTMISLMRNLNDKITQNKNIALSNLTKFKQVVKPDSEVQTFREWKNHIVSQLIN